MNAGGVAFRKFPSRGFFREVPWGLTSNAVVRQDKGGLLPVLAQHLGWELLRVEEGGDPWILYTPEGEIEAIWQEEPSFFDVWEYLKDKIK